MMGRPSIGYGTFRTCRPLSSTWVIPFLDDVGTPKNPAAVAARSDGIDAQGKATRRSGEYGSMSDDCGVRSDA